MYLPQCKNDMREFLNLLRAVHGGKGLSQLVEAAKNSLPSYESEQQAYEILGNRREAKTLRRIVEFRKSIAPHISSSPHLFMLDVAMEDQFRTTAQLCADAYDTVEDDPGDLLIKMLKVLLEDLILSRGGHQGLEACISHFTKSQVGVEVGEREWALRSLAACDHCEIVCTYLVDDVAQILQEKADQLVSAASNAAGSKRARLQATLSKQRLGFFGEEVARCLSERVVCQVLHLATMRLRRIAGMGPWEIVSFPACVGSLMQTFGRVTIMNELPMESYDENMNPLNKENDPSTAQIAVVATLSGWEDIPSNINAILLPETQAVDALSHVAIRARNQKVLFGSCDDDKILDQIKELHGELVNLTLGARGTVEWKIVTPEEINSIHSFKKLLPIFKPTFII